ncbi:transcription termination/antitermination factor NusG [candidate division WOR-1 bacterium RIFOXYA2_FULL_36_21]|uniref:Transcription termination/antitermination protein NusG n=1 Tax=candidate division WOR-1 bacterium RIFOXYB2_FULL_36_35 TaxID=1802578 RepID=A0A1F4S536_UNCSA|nr:MAG: transcription termination/antitermination factor NusG [candidate division WOR-1 bacterium RIFOXYA2_FULL_36_21]OGC15554.1 MAG: transcription termination/antitermination factor NusG [candidate division WOR-1 bacterium RIFOXYB2_FULL_36_35]OGC21332.1 MAG: transcription termination/antitermination factor NusG [candidate division WOR-1 bacterium RIFOXYA12_FULL_36_13]
MTDEGEGVKDVIVGEEAAANKRWYVVQTYSGQEDKVKQAIEKNIDRLGLRERVFQILIPEEDIVELRGKKRIEKKKKMFPGYIFLEMILTDETWHEIRQTPGVARFIGTKIKPTPVIDREMQRVLKQIGVKAERLEVAFEKGEVIRIVSGPFRGYTGSIDEINVDREKLKVLINIFGRDTPVEVNFEHAEKVV